VESKIDTFKNFCRSFFYFNCFKKLAEAFGKEVADVSLIQIFTNLLRDAENDVRTAAI
jgi:hypothetical protein